MWRAVHKLRSGSWERNVNRTLGMGLDAVSRRSEECRVLCLGILILTLMVVVPNDMQ